MADTELIRHQQMWKSFTTAVKFAVGAIVLLLVALDLTLVR